MRRRPFLIAAAATVLALFGVVFVALGPQRSWDFVRFYAEGEATALVPYRTLEDRAARGAAQFALSDFGALNTDALESHAVPWRLTVAALALQDAERGGGAPSRDRVDDILRSYGFLTPTRIVNWPEDLVAPTLEAPLGISVGTVSRELPTVRLTAANLGCASCHAGIAYEPDGSPRPDLAILGAPNTSLDLEAYVQGVYVALNAQLRDEARLLDAVRTLFPDTSADEIATLETFVIPRAQKRLAAIIKAGEGPLPFVNGAPGYTNGVAALHLQLGILPEEPRQRLVGFTAIPDLADRGFRSMLLSDGAYAPHGKPPVRPMTANDLVPAHLDELAAVTAFFTVPSMGVSPARAAAQIPAAQDVFRFLASYRPQPFPGRIDANKARVGASIYATRCASCHGVYEASAEGQTLKAFPNWIGAFDTDPARRDAFGAAAAKAVNRSAYGDIVTARATGAYAAPPLAGLWMSAPYLHNGSVPTLAALIGLRPRPERFMVGGHRLDFDAVGIDLVASDDGVHRYPKGHVAFASPAVIDTRRPGFGNGGHETEFRSLGRSEKQALLEYLKTL
jgi:mono/diheme cytochrome c family protein